MALVSLYSRTAVTVPIAAFASENLATLYTGIQSPLPVPYPLAWAVQFTNMHSYWGPNCCIQLKTDPVRLLMSSMGWTCSNVVDVLWEACQSLTRCTFKFNSFKWCILWCSAWICLTSAPVLLQYFMAASVVHVALLAANHHLGVAVKHKYSILAVGTNLTRPYILCDWVDFYDQLESSSIL